MITRRKPTGRHFLQPTANKSSHRERFSAIRPYIAGRSVLDLGAGSGSDRDDWIHPLDPYTSVFPWRVSAGGRLVPPAPLEMIAVLQRRPGPVQVTAMRQADALAQLSDLTLNTADGRRAAFSRLSRLVREIQVVTIQYEDAISGANALREYLRQSYV